MMRDLNKKFDNSLKRSFGHSSYNSLTDNSGNSLKYNLGVRLYESLWDNLGSDLNKSIWNSLNQTAQSPQGVKETNDA